LNFPKQFRSDFINELNLVIDKMEATPNQMEKKYFLSAIPGFLNRILNIKYDKEILFIERIFNFILKEIEFVLNRELQRRASLNIPSSIPIQPALQQPIPLQDQKFEPSDQYISLEKIPLTLIEPNFFRILIKYLKNFKNSFEKNGDILNPLKDIMELIYSLTGNGRYLVEKGFIKLEIIEEF